MCLILPRCLVNVLMLKFLIPLSVFLITYSSDFTHCLWLTDFAFQNSPLSNGKKLLCLILSCRCPLPDSRAKRSTCLRARAILCQPPPHPFCQILLSPPPPTHDYLFPLALSGCRTPAAPYDPDTTLARLHTPICCCSHYR